jgi:hypothetical protein
MPLAQCFLIKLLGKWFLICVILSIRSSVYKQQKMVSTVSKPLLFLMTQQEKKRLRIKRENEKENEEEPR